MNTNEQNQQAIEEAVKKSEQRLDVETVRQINESAKVAPDVTQPKREQRQEQRFQRQLERDLKRGRLSWKTKAALEERDLAQFGRSLLQEKSTNAKLQDSRQSAQQEQQQLATTRTQIVGSASEPLPPKTLPQMPPTYGSTGGGSSCVGLSIYNKDNEVWVSAGTVAGLLPLRFDPQEGGIIARGGSGDVWAEININGLTGDIISVAVAGGGFIPNNTNTSFHYLLGYFEYNAGFPSVTNYGCGSVDAVICRNWFAAEAPFYGVTMTRSGTVDTGLI